MMEIGVLQRLFNHAPVATFARAWASTTLKVLRGRKTRKHLAVSNLLFSHRVTHCD
jgi:hypothetical protein